MAMPLMNLLKDSTAVLHRQSEGNVFQQSLLKGVLERELYVRYLGQLYIIHRLLEFLLCKFRNDAIFKDVLFEHQFQADFLLRDLEFFNVQAGEQTPVAATAAFLETIFAVAAEDQVGLLGFHYVLWGSKHGGRLLSRSIKKSYGLDDTKGYSYFTPYGDQFFTYWKTFSDSMNSLALSDSQKDGVLRAAAAVFPAVQQIGNELLQSASSTS
jgi:heme oxygenase